MANDKSDQGRLRRLAGKAAALIAKVKDAAQLDFFARFKVDGENGEEIAFPIDVGRDTVWATQKQMAALFGVEQPAVAKQIKNVFDVGELEDTDATHSKLELVQQEDGRSVTRAVSHYSLDVILIVGYRLSGPKATKFRKWANGVLRGYIEDGYALNGARLQNDLTALQRLAEEVRAIRTSERVLYHRVRDTFVACAIDYDPSSREASSFFSYAQDAFHYAVSEHTAAQIVLERADASKPSMGMIALGNKSLTLAEATTAKNYMTRDELRSLELLGEAWLLYAESITHRGMRVSMARLLAKVNELIVANEYKAFPGYDKIRSSRPAANEHARRQYQAYKALPKMKKAS